MKKIISIYQSPPPHWVGDGFPVRTLFSYHLSSVVMSPFLMLDYAGPADFAPSTHSRGVEQHPHRGFETVTIVYQGEVEHRDSTGSSGLIGPGDVQWMTAAAGILHEELHSKAFTRKGGTLEMVQLWINLPAKEKMAPAGYQTLLSKTIPSVTLANNAGQLRVIAGNYNGHIGPAKTFTPIDLWDLRLQPGHTTKLSVTEGHTLALVVLHGAIEINSEHSVEELQMVVLERSGETVMIKTGQDTTLLLLSGKPIEEPVVGYGPFVMNTKAEIKQAIEDLNNGNFGKMHQ